MKRIFGLIKISVIVLAAFCFLTLTACTKFENRFIGSASVSVYKRVVDSGKLHCAYVIYPPSCMRDPNTGILSGISIDALNLVAKKLGLQVVWSEEVGWGTMLEGLQANRYDMVATAVWTNVSRAKVAAFSKALFYTPLHACVKKGDHRFDHGLTPVNSAAVKIATIDGGIGQIVAEEDFPQAKILSMTQMTDLSQNLLNVVHSKADITFADPFTLYRYDENNPNTIANVTLRKPLRVFPDCWMFKRGELQFKAMLDTVLGEIIDNGEMDKIISKYELGHGQVYRVAPAYKSPN